MIGTRTLMLSLALAALGGTLATAGPLAAITGAVRDTGGLPVTGITVHLVETGSSFDRAAVTDQQGQYRFDRLEAGSYQVKVDVTGFRGLQIPVSLPDGARLVVNATLEIAAVTEDVTVTAAPERPFDMPSRGVISRQDLDHIPGALHAGSLAAIIETTPSAVIAHDQLHVRGGHQVGYEIDGVPVPSSSIGANFALLFDPKDLKAIEFQRGSFSAEQGDRLYGQINVVTRSGFERPRSAEVTTIVGQQGQYEGAASYSDHSDKVAFFAQASGNRTGFGLTPPSLPALHDVAWGAGGATRLWAPLGASDLVTLTATLRADDFQVPLGPDATGPAGFGNRQIERDAFVAVQWHRAGAGHLTWSVTPYYHENRVALNPRAVEADGFSSDDRRIDYLGGRADASYTTGKHDIRVGGDFYAGFLRDRFMLPGLDQTGVALDESVRKTGANEAIYLEDRYRPLSDLSLTAGLRADQSRAYRVESALEPRFEVVGHLRGTPFTAHASAGRFFQAPPLEALGVGGASFAAMGDQPFLLVRAERNTQWETGVSADVGGSTVDVTYYDNHASNYLDHQQLGESTVFLPVNIAEARLRGLELSATSPPGKHVRFRLVYAHGYAQARGAITGGLGTIGERTTDGYYFLDHDQRHEAVAGLELQPTERTWAHVAVHYGSGFLRGDGPAHLPPHVTADMAAGFTASARWSVAMEIENLTNAAYFVNLSSEFNGTHVARPRSAAARLRLSF